MRWELMGDPSDSWAEAPVRCETTGRDGFARVIRDLGAYRIDGPVRATIVDAGGNCWRVVVDRAPELAGSALLMSPTGHLAATG